MKEVNKVPAPPTDFNQTFGTGFPSSGFWRPVCNTDSRLSCSNTPYSAAQLTGRFVRYV